MRGLRRCVHYGANGAAIFGKERADGFGIANVEFVMFIFTQVFHQLVTRCFSRSLRPEKLRPHVVIDTDDTQLFLRKTFRRFRTNQAG